MVVYLSGSVSGMTAHACRWRSDMGLLRTPVEGSILPDGVIWAADHATWQGTDDVLTGFWRYVRWLATHDGEQLARCLFVTIPDVYADAEATYRRGMTFLPLLAQLGLPLAWVAQDGLRSDLVPWGAISCLFIGGTVTWKLSARARSWCEEARARGKHVHVGKVNTFKRLLQVSQYADSVDGTCIAYGPDANLSGLESWLNGLNQQTTLQF